VSTSDGKLVISRGLRSAVKAWKPQAIVEEMRHMPQAQRELAESSTLVNLAVCSADSALALASSGFVELEDLSRMGMRDARLAMWQLPATDGALVSMGHLGSRAMGGNAAGSGAALGGGLHDLLFCTTERGGAVAYDPRSGSEAWRLTYETPLGLMQAHASDAGAHWLLLGSSSGHCVLWDLRYALRLKVWQCPNACRIHSMLQVRPTGSIRPSVLMGAADNTIYGWEIGESPRCSLVLQAADAAALSPSGPSGSCGLEPQRPLTLSSSTMPMGAHSVRALLAPLDGSCVLSASSDTRLRCWQLQGDVSKSFTIGGQRAEAPPVAYREVRSTASPSGCRVVQEYTASGVVGAAMPVGLRAMVTGAADAGCTAAITSAVYCAAPQSGLLLAGSLDGTVRVWR